MVFLGCFLTLMLATFINGRQANISLHPFSNEFIEHLNGIDKTWKAGRNFHEETSMKYIRQLMGVLEGSQFFLPPKVHHKIPEDYKFPENFDARTAWPYCPSIREIRDQGQCGSCWAVSSVEVMTDRECIHSKGERNFHYSAEDLMACCSECGYGCNGGLPGRAFDHWIKSGIVSGGPYNSTQGCQPYEIPPSKHHLSANARNSTDIYPTPKCSDKCEDNYPQSYSHDKHFGSYSYSIYGEKNIMYELIQNGSISASFFVYEDFFSYKSGVYEHKFGKMVGRHAIRMLGYGVENGIPYWLCANSWNSSWGDKGFFKILRGKWQCDIENQIMTGIPKFNAPSINNH